ncbi:MAG: recombination protein RecR [Candidatus Amoebophilus sp. 36-38]|nr:MAG: recombination protein RecR [Candidatus Amoebophilus sp. 36-38]
MSYTSKLIEEAVNEIATLPGIGKKTALRLALFLLKNNPEHTERLANSLRRLRSQIQYCRQCHNIADAAVCSICANPHRDSGIICVVENLQDVIAIENTAQYKGKYHVLGGLISPIEGVGPEQLHIEHLLQRAQTEQLQEIIFALSTTIEGDTTTFYITKKLKDFPIKLSSIARGVAVGTELEYTDEMTLARSIKERIVYH